jgi:hypothetical protein
MVEMITATASIWELIAFVSALAGLIGSAVGLGLPTWDLMVAQNGENAALRRSGHERLRLSIILVVAFAAFFFHASVLVVFWLWLLALLPGGRWRVRMAAAHGATSFFPYSGESLPVAWATMNSDARRIPNACMSFPASID